LKRNTASESSTVEFCALEYRPQGDTSPDTIDPKIVVILRWTESHHLSIRFDPDWRSFVLDSHREYTGSLLEDFAERAHLDPDDLMLHLSSLNFGPIVTRFTGSDLAQFSQLDELWQRFTELTK